MSHTVSVCLGSYRECRESGFPFDILNLDRSHFIEGRISRTVFYQQTFVSLLFSSFCIYTGRIMSYLNKNINSLFTCDS